MKHSNSRRRTRKAALICLAFLATACGTYRKSGGGYQANSPGFKTSSDYVAGEAGIYRLTDKIPRGQAYVPSGEFRLYWPVRNVRVNRGFKPAGKKHEGVDLGGPKGTPILAAHEGVVIYKGHDFSGYGNMVLIEFNKEWATLYGHLDDIAVDEGRIVKPGDPIGTMGRTGRATGVHLHFELIHARSPVDPLPYLTRASHMAAR